MKGIKTSNDYARSLSHYARTPKSVYAALAYSLAARLSESDHPGVIEAFLNEEWHILSANGIVPQPCPKRDST